MDKCKVFVNNNELLQSLTGVKTDKIALLVECLYWNEPQTYEHPGDSGIEIYSVRFLRDTNDVKGMPLAGLDDSDESDQFYIDLENQCFEAITASREDYPASDEDEMNIDFE